jgi:hypothetical protein
LAWPKQWKLLGLEPIFTGATRLDVHEMFRRTAVRCLTGRTLTVNAVPMEVGRQAPAQESNPVLPKRQCSSADIYLTTRSLALQSNSDSCLPIAASARQEGRLSFSYLLTGISVRISCGTVVSFALTAPNRRGACLLWWRGFPSPQRIENPNARAHIGSHFASRCR